MFRKVKNVLVKIHHEEEGSYFIEMALVLVGVALTVFVAANSLSKDGIIPQYNEIKNEVSSVDVPDLNP